MLMPSKELRDQMSNVMCGFWLENMGKGREAVYVAKLQTNVIKAVQMGAIASFIISVIQIEGHKVRVVGLQVGDDPVHPFTTYRSHTDLSEHALFEKSLTNVSIPFYFFDELERNVLACECTPIQGDVVKLMLELPNLGPHYIGPQSAITGKALDIFQEDLDAEFNHSLLKSSLFLRVNLKLTSFAALKMFALGTGQFRLDQTDEGGGLEQSAHQLIESLYPLSHYRSPQIQDGALRRELTDLLTFDSEGLCLIESKALSEFNVDLSRSMAKRIAQIRKDIDKGIRQLSGALKKVRSDARIMDSKGHEIQIPGRLEVTIHVILLISDMNTDLEWMDLASRLVAASKNNAFFHIMDLTELRNLVGVGQASLFHSVLIQRFNKVREIGNAGVRCRIRNES